MIIAVMVFFWLMPKMNYFSLQKNWYTGSSHAAGMSSFPSGHRLYTDIWECMELWPNLMTNEADLIIAIECVSTIVLQAI